MSFYTSRQSDLSYIAFGRDAGTRRIHLPQCPKDYERTTMANPQRQNLAQNPGRVLSREALLERVWGYGYFGDGRLVDVHVRRLRTKIESDPANPRHVVTVRGLGYKLQT